MALLFLQVTEKKEVFQETGLKELLQCFKRQDLLAHQTITIPTHRIRIVALFRHHAHHLATLQVALHRAVPRDQARLPVHLVEDEPLKEDNLYFHFRKNEKIYFHCFHVAFFKATSPVSI
jgi:hypothetical protein